jgi:BlaI family transcriptional regulator, penicillinase repressor
MARKRSTGPTEGELEILRVLWNRGPSTVRQIHQTLLATKQTTYNTTLKLLQIMTDKGTVLRDEQARPQVYRPSVPEDQMQRHLASDFVHRVFGGSARKLVAAVAQKASPKELAEIRKLLDSLKGGRS